MSHPVRIHKQYEGRIQDFHLRGGGHKRLCACTHISSAKPEVPFGRGPDLIRALEALGLFYALSCYLFLSILIQNGIKTNMVYTILGRGGGGRRLLPPLPGSVTEYAVISIMSHSQTLPIVKVVRGSHRHHNCWLQAVCTRLTV